MRQVPRRWLRDKAQVERRTGAGSRGQTFAAAVEVRGLLEERRRLIRDESGQEVVSEAQFFYDPRTETIPTGSRIVVKGRATRVIAHSEEPVFGTDTPAYKQAALA